MSFDDHANFALTTVTVAPSPATSGTSLTVVYAAVFPTPPFNATVWPAGRQALTGEAEIVRVTGSAFNVLTIVREQEGTFARAIVPGDQVAATVTKKTLADLEDALGAPRRPVVARVQQAYGSDGSAVTFTVYGAGFTGTSAVLLGGSAVTSFTVLTDLTLSVTATPAYEGTGYLIVTTPNGDSLSTHDAIVLGLPATPTIFNLTPATGPAAGGALVTLFVSEVQTLWGDELVDDLTFGGTSATWWAPVSKDVVVCQTPAHAAGAVDVVMTTDGHASAPVTYTYV